MVEIFKTNVCQATEAEGLIRKLAGHFPANRINFDLSDCDRILRVEGASLLPEKIIALMTTYGYDAELIY